MSRDKRSLYLLFFGTFFIYLNFNIAQTVTPIYILNIGGTEFYSGLQSTLFYLSAVILRFYFGPLADRKGNRITLFIGGMAFMTAPLLFLLNDSVIYILLVRIYQAIGLAAFFSSASAMVSALAPQEKLGAYIGFYRLVSMSTLLMGPSIALKVIDGYGYQWYHTMGIIIGFMAMIFLHFVHEPERLVRSRFERKDLPSSNMLGLLKQKNLVPIYQGIFIISIGYGLIQTFTAIYIGQFASEINPGIFFTVFGVGSLISNLTSGPLSDRKGRLAVVFPCMMVLGIGMALFFFLPSYHWIMYIGSLLTGFGFAGGISVSISWVIDTAPAARRTTALALQDSSIDIGIALGGFLFGVVIPIIGMSWAYAISGSLLFVYAVWNLMVTVLAKRKVRPTMD